MNITLRPFENAQGNVQNQFNVNLTGQQFDNKYEKKTIRPNVLTTIAQSKVMAGYAIAVYPIEVASVIELSEASGWVAAGLFMTEG